MRKYSFIPALFLCLCATTAHAQSSLEHFLDKVEAASELSDCKQTQEALDKITDAEFNAAITDIKAVKNQSLLTKYQEKFAKFEKFTAKCPKVHDQFANKMSLLTVHAHLSQKTSNPDSIRKFVNWCEKATHAENCKKSAENLAKFPEKMCEDAIAGFQSIPPSAFPDKEYKEIQSKLEKIITWGSTCPEYQQTYDACLTSKAANFQSLSKLEPFFNFLHDLNASLKSTECEKISNLKINEELYLKAKTSVSGLSPAQFSPTDRAKIREEMHAVYEGAKTCPAAHTLIDSLIEKMFTTK